MSDFPFSVVLICAASVQAKANLLACALGHDVLPGSTYSVPLSSGEPSSVTHYGCRTGAQQTFVDILLGASTGTLPDIPWEDFGLTVEDVWTVLAGLMFDIRGAEELTTHFDAVLAENGLTRISTNFADNLG
jgi:hypothetical protein